MSYEHPQSPPPSSADQTRTLGMLAHLGGILAYFYVGWLPALVIWLVNREKSNEAADEARVALNFQLTVLIALIVCAIVRSIPVIGIVGWLGVHRREHREPGAERPGRRRRAARRLLPLPVQPRAGAVTAR